MGAEYGYQLLWVLALSTLALIVFHEVGARVGLVTGQGLTGLIRDRYGVRAAAFAVLALVVANVGTTCGEFAGVAASLEPAVPRRVSVPVAAVGVSLLVLRGSFHRIEHILLVLSTVFATYLVSAVLAHPDWSAAGRGLVVPSIPLTGAALLAATACLGTTLAPWGLAFIQSYAVDKRLTPDDLPYERIDVVRRSDHDRRDRGRRRHRLCGDAPRDGPRSRMPATRRGPCARWPAPWPPRCSRQGCWGRHCWPRRSCRCPPPTRSARRWVTRRPSTTALRCPHLLHQLCGDRMRAVAIVLIPNAPLVQILFLSQALNAVLLLPLLVFIARIAGDAQVMGRHANGRVETVVVWTTTAVIAVCVGALGVFSVV